MKIGDFVGSKFDTTKGRVLAIDKDRVVIITEDGFDLSFLKKDLIVYQSDLVQDNSVIKKDFSTTEKPKKNFASAHYIDLHYKGKKNDSNEILTWQIELFNKELKKAIQKNIAEIVFNHGYGDGILKSKIEAILKKRNIVYSEAPYHQFGLDAAIIVHLKLNPKTIL